MLRGTENIGEVACELAMRMQVAAHIGGVRQEGPGWYGMITTTAGRGRDS